MTETFASISDLAIYSSMAVYTFAFIAFALNLVTRAAPVARDPALTQIDSAPAITDGPSRASRALTVAMALTVLGWILNVVGVVFRGIAAGYAPWSNMFGFAITSAALIVGVFLLVQFWQDVRFLGAYIVGFALVTLGAATVNFAVAIVPLPPPLQSAWLVIHVFVAILGTSFFALGAALAVAQLLQAKREARGTATGYLATLPSAEKLENLSYRVVLVGFVFWTFTLIAGAIWAERAWGRYWGWDVKEVWTFIIWTLYAGYIHARATRGWRGARSAWLSIIGFASVVFNFTIVNQFFKGLHSYSGL
ncbi:MAG: c-type cytochrome biogenesis protein CcsB [Microbacteriaceae bacterium]